MAKTTRREHVLCEVLGNNIHAGRVVFASVRHTVEARVPIVATTGAFWNVRCCRPAAPKRVHGVTVADGGLWIRSSQSRQCLLLQPPIETPIVGDLAASQPE